MIAVKEERARIGGVEVAKKTVIAATEEGLVWILSRRVNLKVFSTKESSQQRLPNCTLVDKRCLCIAFYKRRWLSN